MTVKYVYNADSWDSFIADLKHKPILPCWGSSPASIKGTAKFSGSKSYDDSLKLAEYGCPTTREAIHNAMFKTSTQFIPEWETAPVGVFPCIPAYAAGVPEDMFIPSEQGTPVPKPIVRIVVNITASHRVSKEHIINRGAAIVHLIDRVQLSGQRVELVATFTANDMKNNNTYDFSVVVKRAEEPIDLDRIAYAISHPSMLRRTMFRIMEQTVPYKVSGYGTATDFMESVKDQDLYIKSMLSDLSGYETRDTAKDTVSQLWDMAVAA